MPGLLRGIARTAVIAGTATAVSNRVSRRQAGRWANQDQQRYDQSEDYEQQPDDERSPASQPDSRYEGQAYESPDVGAAPADSMPDKLEQLQRLGDLKSQGVLTQAEFDEQKQRILR